MAKVEGETKGQAFVRLANKRTKNALKMIGLLKNLGSYPHTAAHTATIVTALKNAVEDVEYSLAGDKTKKKDEFDLGGADEDFG